MNTCALEISPKCRENIGNWRGICSECWKYLIENKIIVKDEPYPEWLDEMIKMQENYEGYSERNIDVFSDFGEENLTDLQGEFLF